MFVAGVTPHFMARGIVLAALGLMLFHYWWRARHPPRRAADAVRAHSSRSQNGR